MCPHIPSPHIGEQEGLYVTQARDWLLQCGGESLLQDYKEHVQAPHAEGTLDGYYSCLARMSDWHQDRHPDQGSYHFLSLCGLVQYLIFLRKKGDGMSPCAEAIASHAFGRKSIALAPVPCAWLVDATRPAFKKAAEGRVAPLWTLSPTAPTDASELTPDLFGASAVQQPSPSGPKSSAC